MEKLQQQLEDLRAQDTDLQRLLAERPPHQTDAQPPEGQGQRDLLGVQDPPTVNRVAVKLPPFWSDKPALWFAQVEAQFDLAAITRETTKFYHIVSQLEGRYASEVEDIIISPPDQNAYRHLKTELIKRLGKSEEQRVRELMSAEELGNRKPSQFLRHLRSLAGTTAIQDPLMRTLWLQRLPAHVQAILQTQASLSLAQTADIADKIMEVEPPIPIPATYSTTAPAVDLSSLSQRLDDLSRQVTALSTRSGSRERPRTRPPSRTHSPRASADNDSLCWYHQQFGKKATRCRSPCNYQENSSGST